MNQIGPHWKSIEEGLIREYRGLEAHQLAIHHGIEDSIAKALKDGTIRGVRPEQHYKFVMVQGGYRSGKTHADVNGMGTNSIQFSDHVGLVVRKRKETLRNTYLHDFKRWLERVSENNINWLLLDEREDDGAVELLIRSVGRPSLVIFRCEPDGTEEFVKSYWKGRELSRFTCEEVSELKWKATVDTLCTRLSWTGGPVRGTLLTNPALEGTDVATKFAQFQRELMNGEKPYMLPILCSVFQNQSHLPKTYIPDLQRQYKDDPVGYEMAINGTTGLVTGGVPVFKGFYNEALHIRPDIKFDPELPLIRGWDFGHGEAHCGFWQRTKSMRLEKLAELVGQGQFAEAYADDVQSYTKAHFPFVPKGVIDYGDHAGNQDNMTGNTVQVINKRLGIRMHTQAFGNIDPGLDHMRKLLSETRDNGIPRITYHPRCLKTRTAMRFGYYYKKMSDGRLMARPFANEYEHGIDADRYVVCHEVPIARDHQDIKNIKAKGIVDIRRVRAEQSYEEWLKAGPAKLGEI